MIATYGSVLFYGKFNMRFWSFRIQNFLLLEKIPHLKMLKITKFSLCDARILLKIKFGNFRRSKSAILFILEALNFDYEKIPHLNVLQIIKIPNLTKWKLQICLPRSVFYGNFGCTEEEKWVPPQNTVMLDVKKMDVWNTRQSLGH